MIDPKSVAGILLTELGGPQKALTYAEQTAIRLSATDSPITGQYTDAARELREHIQLTAYRVMLNEEKGDKFQLAFDCRAEDDDHAAEQAKNAYPAGEIISVTPFGDDDSLTPRI